MLYRSRFLWVVSAVLLFGGERAVAEEKPSRPPKLYGFCVDRPARPNASISAQAKLLGELGFDGAGYPLWVGEGLEKNLQVLNEAGLELSLAFIHVDLDLDSKKPAYDPRVPAALAKLKGRPVTIAVLFRGYPPGDPRGMERGVKVLRELSDLAAKSGLRISIYHHVKHWTESVLYSLEVVQRVDRSNVGVNFNLCHWLKVDGDKDYRPVLRENARQIFAVTINGAQRNSKTFENGLVQPLDRGDFDNRELLGLLREIGYDGPVGLMCWGIPDDTREHLQRSMHVWKSWHQP
jgi:sugar phosphate isomerase/epimerase